MQQQIIISGVGGQGILFITKLLAETALSLGYSVLISETHGMAQRGGNVISHLKVYPGSHCNPHAQSGIGTPAPSAGDSVAGTCFFSPLIRPGRADVLLALHPEALLAHGFYLKPEGAVFRNALEKDSKNAVDAQAIATKLGSPVSANLVLLGFAAGLGGVFCTPKQLEETLEQYGGKRQEINLGAFRAGMDEAARKIGE